MNKFNTILTLAIILAAGNAQTIKALNGEVATRLDELFKHCSAKGPSLTGLNLRTVVRVRSQEQCFNDYAKAAKEPVLEAARILVAPLKAKLAADYANAEKSYTDADQQLAARFATLESAPATEKAALIAALLSEARLLAAAQAQAETPATAEPAAPAVEPAPAIVEASTPTETAETPAAN